VTVRPIRLLGDPVLRTVCEPVTQFDRGLAQLVDDLIDTVQVPGRAGPAANQIGVSLAVFAYNVDGALGYVINPVLAVDPGEQDGPEACLSIRGVTATRRRAEWATITGTDLRGDPVTVSGDGELARCLQHETGHLQGELFIDRLDRRERAQIMRQLRLRPGLEQRTGSLDGPDDRRDGDPQQGLDLEAQVLGGDLDVEEQRPGPDQLDKQA
jgi:peptide deformylase